MNRRRRIKRRPAVYRGRKIQVNFVPVIVIICLSVCAGYLTAKYLSLIHIYRQKEGYLTSLWRDHFSVAPTWI